VNIMLCFFVVTSISVLYTCIIFNSVVDEVLSRWQMIFSILSFAVLYRICEVFTKFSYCMKSIISVIKTSFILNFRRWFLGTLPFVYTCGLEHQRGTLLLLLLLMCVIILIKMSYTVEVANKQ